VKAELDELIIKLKPHVLSLVYEHEHGFSRNGQSWLLGGDHDRDLLIALRLRSDLIVTSGTTAELEQYSQPSKPLVLITTRPSAAAWLEAKRLELDDPELISMIAQKSVLYETGLTISRLLFEKQLIDQIVIHHDYADFDTSILKGFDIRLCFSVNYYQRHISVFERRGR
jgi:riboflavin biosynthesis pyrimidine reductase